MKERGTTVPLKGKKEKISINENIKHNSNISLNFRHEARQLLHKNFFCIFTNYRDVLYERNVDISNIRVSNTLIWRTTNRAKRKSIGRERVSSRQQTNRMKLAYFASMGNSFYHSRGDTPQIYSFQRRKKFGAPVKLDRWFFISKAVSCNVLSVLGRTARFRASRCPLAVGCHSQRVLFIFADANKPREPPRY